MRIGESTNRSPTLLPLYAGVVDTDQSVFLSEGLWGEQRFGPSTSHPWAVTSVAKTHPGFDSVRYWRGPVWVNMNWFLIRGLQRCGRVDEADRLRRHTLDLVSQHGMYEYYDPETGRGRGSPDFSWTAALTLDLLERP